MANEGLASIGVRQTAMDMERRTRVRQTEMPNEIAEGLGSLSPVAASSRSTAASTCRRWRVSSTPEFHGRRADEN
jgi:hypothetical protein